MNPDKEPAALEAIDNVCRLDQIEQVAQAKENRQLKHWLIRRSFGLFSFLIVIATITIVIDFIFLKNPVHNAAEINSFFGSVFQVFKVMLEQT